MRKSDLSHPRRVISVEIGLDIELKNDSYPAVLVTHTSRDDDQGALSSKRLQKYFPARVIAEGSSDHFHSNKEEVTSAKRRARRLLSDIGYTVYSGAARKIYVVSLAPIDSNTWFYVGETGIRIEERIQQHKAGGKTAAKVWRRMEERVPSLEPSTTYWSIEDSRNAEIEWGLHLYSLGYRVIGPKGFDRKSGAPLPEK